MTINNNQEKKQIFINNLYKLAIYIVIGILGGYLFNRNSKVQGLNYYLVSIVFFLIIGIIDYIITVCKQIKNIDNNNKENK